MLFFICKSVMFCFLFTRNCERKIVARNSSILGISETKLAYLVISIRSMIEN